MVHWIFLSPSMFAGFPNQLSLLIYLKIWRENDRYLVKGS